MQVDFVFSQILRLCRQPRTFEFISKNLSGLDPIKINSAIQELLEQEQLVKKADLFSLAEKEPSSLTLHRSENQYSYLRKYMGHFDFLKVPHPLDFEWRNSSESLSHLVKIVQESNSVHDRVLFLGMPTLFALCCINDIPQNVTLVERNRPILDGLKALITRTAGFRLIEADIFHVNPVTIGKYHSVFMDPPWYSEHFYQFMWLAASCVEIGGFVCISLPPINTRPNIDEERIKWFSFCQENGLCIENLHAQNLHYAMPFFEFNAFRAAGIQDILPFWRKGDLAFFRKVADRQVERPISSASDLKWVEREIGSVRLRVLGGQIDAESSKIEISSIVKGDILPSISTREASRQKANIWTSGNRVFRTNQPNRLIQIIDENQENNAASEEHLYISGFLETVSDFENREYGNYLDWLYHEMERQID